MLIKEKDFQDSIIREICHKFLRYKKIKSNSIDLQGSSIYEKVTREYLINRYKIDVKECNNIINHIHSKITNRNWIINNKIGFKEIINEGISTEKTKQDELPQYQLIDFENMENNVFQISDEVVFGNGIQNRADIVIFINGLPIIIMELKSPVYLSEKNTHICCI